jgi:hypothetical protein
LRYIGGGEEDEDTYIRWSESGRDEWESQRWEKRRDEG